MKEYPILMHQWSVSKILAGHKKQTRRIIKPQPPYGLSLHCWYDAPVYGWTDKPFPTADWYKAKCPYGVIGDRLWVRESFSYQETAPCNAYAVYRDGNGKHYNGNMRGRWMVSQLKFKPSIHMPRWASRLTLEITDIRVERVQEISEADAMAEGCEITDEVTGCAEDLDGSYKKAFSFLWYDTNGKGAWERNDWVWIVDFKVVTP